MLVNIEKECPFLKENSLDKEKIKTIISKIRNSYASLVEDFEITMLESIFIERITSEVEHLDIKKVLGKDLLNKRIIAMLETGEFKTLREDVNEFLNTRIKRIKIYKSISTRIFAKGISRNLKKEGLELLTDEFLQNIIISISRLSQNESQFVYANTPLDFFYTYLNNINILEIVSILYKETINLCFSSELSSIIPTLNWESVYEEFVAKIITKLSLKFSNEFPSFNSHLPWHRITKSQVERLVNKLFLKLNPQEKKFEINLIVLNLAPQRSVWKVGKIEFFNPQKWYHGSKYIILPKIKFHDRSDFSGARIFVNDKTEFGALQKAKEYLRETLDFYTLWHSARSSFGFNASIHYVEAIRFSNDFWVAPTFEKPKEDLAIKGIEKGEKILLSSSKIDNLVLMSSERPEDLTDLQNSFLRSLSWYRMGRWSDTSTEKYLNYWISLENLFIREDRFTSEVFRKKLSELFITWRDIDGFIILNTLYQIRKFIENDPTFQQNINNDPALKDWHFYPHIPLENLTVLENHAIKQEEKDYIRKFRAELTSERWLKTKHGVENERIKFTLMFVMLYSLRNRIVHAGLNYTYYLPFYIDELQKILEICLIFILPEDVIFPRE